MTSSESNLGPVTAGLRQHNHTLGDVTGLTEALANDWVRQQAALTEVYGALGKHRHPPEVFIVVAISAMTTLFLLAIYTALLLTHRQFLGF